MPAGAKVPDSTAIVLYHFNDVWGGGQKPFGTFPKIHPFWKGKASLRDVAKKKREKSGQADRLG